MRRRVGGLQRWSTLRGRSLSTLSSLSTMTVCPPLPLSLSSSPASCLPLLPLPLIFSFAISYYCLVEVKPPFVVFGSAICLQHVETKRHLNSARGYEGVRHLSATDQQQTSTVAAMYTPPPPPFSSSSSPLLPTFLFPSSERGHERSTSSVHF